jgi:opacity protein-like surface antigen
LAQSSDGFTPLTPTPSSTTPLYTSGDINPDLPASNYRYGSLSLGFGSQSNVDVKENGVKSREIGFNSAFSFNAAVGYQFEQVRAELEIGNQFLSGKDIKFVRGGTIPLPGSLNATTILLNGYYDIPTGSKLRPYVGGGLGLGVISGKIRYTIISRNRFDSFEESLDGTSFAYQLKAGLQYEISRKGNIFGELKYSSISGYNNKEYTNTDYGPFNSFGVAIGYRQGF